MIRTYVSKRGESSIRCGAMAAAVTGKSIVIERKFHRKPPPLPFRLAFGCFVHGVLVPGKWLAGNIPAVERLADRFMARRAQHNNFDKKGFEGFTPGPQDVFVPTFSKSGTNWMMQIAVQLAYHGQAEFEHIHELVPWPDMVRMPYAIPLKDADHWKTAPEGKRVIKSHLDWENLPYSPEARYLCVIRDPKDVFVSSYHFAKSTIGAGMPSVDTWFKIFVEERFPLGGSWVTNTAGYWAASKRHPNVMISSFKEMKRDLRGTVERVAGFLDIRVGADVLDLVTEKSSFQYMKQADRKFAMFQMIPWGEPSVMVREGKQGGSSSLLTPARQREIDERFQTRLKELGCDFPYAEFCDVRG